MSSRYSILLCLVILSLVSFLAGWLSADRTKLGLKSIPNLKVDGFELLAREADCIAEFNRKGYKNYTSQGGWRAGPATEIVIGSGEYHPGRLISLTGHSLSCNGVALVRIGDPRMAAEAAIIPLLDSVGKGPKGVAGYGQDSRCKFELGVYFESGLVERILLRIARRPEKMPIVTPTLPCSPQSAGACGAGTREVSL